MSHEYKRCILPFVRKSTHSETALITGCPRAVESWRRLCNLYMGFKPEPDSDHPRHLASERSNTPYEGRRRQAIRFPRVHIPRQERSGQRSKSMNSSEPDSLNLCCRRLTSSDPTDLRLIARTSRPSQQRGRHTRARLHTDACSL